MKLRQLYQRHQLCFIIALVVITNCTRYERDLFIDYLNISYKRSFPIIAIEIYIREKSRGLRKICLQMFHKVPDFFIFVM